MDSDRRSFLKKSAGTGIVALLLRGTLGKMAVHLTPRALGWGGLRFSTNAVRAALPHPAVRIAVEAVAAATAVVATLKGAKVVSKPVITNAVLNFSTAAVRSQLPHPKEVA